MKKPLIYILIILLIILVLSFVSIWTYGRYLCKGLNNPDNFLKANETRGISWDEVACSQGALNYFDYGFRNITHQI